MKNQLCATLVLMLLATACATTRLRTGFDDVPLPRGLTYQPQRSVVIESPSVKAAKLVYRGRLEPESLGLAMRTLLESNGWRHVGSTEEQSCPVVRSAREELLHQPLLAISRLVAGELTHGERQFHGLGKIAEIDGLDDVVEGTAGERLACPLFVGCAADHDHGHVGRKRPDARQRLKAAEARQKNIQENQIRRPLDESA